MWESLWEQFIDELPDHQCNDVVESVGIPVPGFRRGAKNIPPSKARMALKSAPARRRGKPFLDWFQNKFEDLVSDLDILSADELEGRREQYVDKYPARLVAVAVAMRRPELLESWQPWLDEQVEKQSEQIAQKMLEALTKQVEALTERLAARDKELEEAKRREKALESEQRKLTRRADELIVRLEKAEYELRNADEKRKAAVQAIQMERNEAIAKYEEMVGQFSSWEAELEQREADVRELRNQGKVLQDRIEQYEERIARYRESRLQAESLFLLYRSLSGHLSDAPEDVARRVLVVGDSFPEQHFRVSDLVLRVTGVSSPEQVDGEFVDLCKTFDQVIVLSACPHRVRMGLYQHLGSGVTEIGGLSQFASAIVGEE